MMFVAIQSILFILASSIGKLSDLFSLILLSANGTTFAC
jgi:hypothetical protein